MQRSTRGGHAIPSELIAAQDRLLTETEASDWPGQVRWLSAWQ